MSCYVETIRIDNGRIHNLELHQQRMAATIREAYGPHAEVPALHSAIHQAVTLPPDGLHKCRVTYDTAIRSIEVAPYTPRIITSLRMVTATPDFDYHLKSTDRSGLSALAACKGTCSDVIIVRRGLVTDTSFTNLVFRSADGLLTPATPLLPGTMRCHLLDSGLIRPLRLTPADILPGNRYGISHAILINAMLPLHVAPAIPVTAIQ